MLEVISLLVLQDLIADMARRRERSTFVFRCMFFMCWFVGECVGAVAGYFLGQQMGSQREMLFVWGGSLLGAICGGVIAFLWAKSKGPLNGRWLDLSEHSAKRSRMLGTIVGGVGGIIIGGGVAAYLSGNPFSEINRSLVLQSGFAAGFVGTILGLVSGIQTSRDN